MGMILKPQISHWGNICVEFSAPFPIATFQKTINLLAEHARQRGKDSSGIVRYTDGVYEINRADYDIKKLLKRSSLSTRS